MSLPEITAWTVWPLALLALAAAAVLLSGLRRQPAGNEAMRAWGGQVQAAADAFARRQTLALAPALGVLGLLLWPVAGRVAAAAFVVGAACGLAAIWGAVLATTRAGTRTAEAARAEGGGRALGVAASGAAALGLALGGLGLLGVSLLYWAQVVVNRAYSAEQYARLGDVLAGLALGVSVTALFARVGGGIFTRAAGIGAGLLGAGGSLGPDDPRNPATVAENAGSSVGDAAGTGVDLMESYVSALVAAVMLGATGAAYADSRAEAVALPLLAAGGGLLASGLGLVAVRFVAGRAPAVVLRLAGLGALVLFVLLALAVVNALGFDLEDPATGARYGRFGPFWALLAGAGAAVAVGLAGEMYATARPVRRVLEAARSGPATAVLMGIAVGMESVAAPLVLIAAGVWAADAAAGLYGIGMAAVGMLGTAAVRVAVGGFAAIADTGAGIARMSHLGRDAQGATGELQRAGAAAAAGDRAVAIAAAAFTALALFAAYASAVRLDTVNVIHPFVVLGLLLGGAVPFVAAALVLAAVGRTAARVGAEARRQLAEVPGILEAAVPPDSARCADVATRAALRETTAPCVLAVVAPVLVGAALGPQALGGLLVGATVVGILLALFLTAAGGAWHRAHLAAGAGAGDDDDGAAGATRVADAVGDPFRGAAGPALAIVVKLMAVAALVLAPWFLSLRGEAPPPVPAGGETEARAEWSPPRAG